MITFENVFLDAIVCHNNTGATKPMCSTGFLIFNNLKKSVELKLSLSILMLVFLKLPVESNEHLPDRKADCSSVVDEQHGQAGGQPHPAPNGQHHEGEMV